jgi:pimeloyl-ACP methyl ester carboxylesterase
MAPLADLEGATNEPQQFVSHFVTAQDGLRLHVREYGPRATARLPVVCLPGLSRNSADFHVLATELMHNRERRVLALDYRGRGGSDHDLNPANYNPAVEAGDVIAVLTALGIEAAVFVATSRGGILTMLLAALRPAIIAGAVLNDIGPVIEPAGLLRIKGYVGKLPKVDSLEQAADTLQLLFGVQFPTLTQKDWLAEARRSFQEVNGRLQPTYDTALAHALDGVPPDGVLPPMWNQFDALGGVPLMVIRGAKSDILSAETVQAMRARRANMQVLEVPNQGHPPSLEDATTIGRIADFIIACETSR